MLKPGANTFLLKGAGLFARNSNLSYSFFGSTASEHYAEEVPGKIKYLCGKIEKISLRNKK